MCPILLKNVDGFMIVFVSHPYFCFLTNRVSSQYLIMCVEISGGLDTPLGESKEASDERAKYDELVQSRGLVFVKLL